jgi:glyoxylase-like metal-dependent hydrolase (beta-lactamase superfamily II)
MTTDPNSNSPEVTADELRAALNRGDPVHVLDVRPRSEFEEWRIPGSRHVGGYEALQEGRSDVYANASLPDEGPIVTVCGAGKTSREAARQLRAQGRDAYSLSGGLRGWTFAWNVAETSSSDAVVVQVRRTGKGCLSSLVGSGDEALVIDPSVSPEVYETLADERGWTIVGVLDTHVHADHLSRARRLADATGATLYLPKQERVSFEHRSLRDGEEVAVGDATLTALHTPGHTPESTTYRLGDDALFTGDTLFPEGVGRPDLDADAAEGRRKARVLYRSLQRLVQFPYDVMVLPGHASEPVPFDGKIVGAPLGMVTREVEALQWSEDRFVETILERVPPTPPNYETIIDRNREGTWPDDPDLVDLEAGGNRCAVG